MSSEDSKPRVAVAIPCFNEAPTVAKVVADFAKVLPEAEIYVFDNNSTDGTAEIARRAGALVVRSPLQGKGNVVRHIATHIEADIYVLVDGDDTYPAASAPALLARFREDQLDMLVATRLDDFEDGAFRAFHRLGNRWISWLISRLFRTQLTDVLSGYRIVSRAFFDIVRVRTGGFEVETEMTLQALTKRMVIAETPVPYGCRESDSDSKLSTWSDGFLIVKCILLLFKDYKPMLFFTVIAALLAVGALVSGFSPVQDYMESGFVYHVPRAILGAALGILSLISLTAGLILDTIAKLHDETIEFWKQHLREHR